MNWFGNKITPRKSEVPAPKGIYLARGLGFPAVGMIGFTVAGIEDIDPVPKIIGGAAGLLFCLIGVIHILVYLSQIYKFNKYTPKWDKGRGFFDRFALEMNQMDDTGVYPSSCDSDMQYHLKLQRKRLEAMNLRMHSQIFPSKDEGASTISSTVRSPWYSSDINREQIIRKLSFEDTSGRNIYHRNVGYTMSQMVIHSPDDNRCQELRVACPNCGAVVKVGQLEQGCEFCNTRFSIRDLFPYVTNTYFVRSNTSTKNSVVFTVSLLLSIVAVFVATLLYGKTHWGYSFAKSLFYAYLVGAMGGGFFGLIFADIVLVISASNRDGMRHIPMFKYIGAKSRIGNVVKQYDPSFLYEKFEGQVVSLIKMAVFTEDPDNLASYQPTVRNPQFDRIVDMIYGGVMILREAHMSGNMLFMTIRTWWCNYAYENGKIKKRGDLIDVTIMRNVANMQAPGFSISAVGCPQCGGSFDAVRQRNCPFCGTAYHMENENWVIADMKLL